MYLDRMGLKAGRILGVLREGNTHLQSSKLLRTFTNPTGELICPILFLGKFVTVQLVYGLGR